jgi:peptidoglycan/LPS O-acetylase OafA/YrhL
MAPAAARRNNFDLIRLAAASQVLWVHAVRHMQIELAQPLVAFDWLLRAFPGVPLFFVVSGFLVTDAWIRAPDPFIYARNRLLRVFPALWASIAFSLALLLGFGFGPTLANHSHLVLLWLLAQASVVQVWNPDFLRGFGVGVVNGSLWTIPVELQFYAALPLLLRLPRRAWPAIVAASLLVYALVEGPRPLPLPNRLLLVSLLPWLSCFGLGVLARLHLSNVLPWVTGRFAAWLGLHLAVHAAAAFAGLADLPWVEAATRPLLAALVLSAAFTRPTLAAATLGGHDISYGLYLVHMPVLNAFVEGGRAGSVPSTPVAVLLCYALALASWLAVERPALRLKDRPLIRRGAEPVSPPG